MSVSRYPLAWPAGWPRGQQGGLRSGNFTVTFDKALAELGHEIKRLGGRYPVVSTNLELRIDGQPRHHKVEPADRGVAVYFDLKGTQKVFACDTFTSVKDNIRAIGLTIAAIRAMQRYGATAMLERTLSAFTALPAPKSCWEVLAIAPTRNAEAIRSAYRVKATSAHPDRGGSHDAMATLNRARDEALKGAAA